MGLPNAMLSTTATTSFAATYTPGETVPILAGYNQAGSPTTITVFQATRTDSVQVGSYPVSGTFLPTAQTVHYKFPTTYPVSTAMRVDLTLTFPGGSQRLRCFAYRVANAARPRAT